jgi:hypothetical protein
MIIFLQIQKCFIKGGIWGIAKKSIYQQIEVLTLSMVSGTAEKATITK